MWSSEGKNMGMTSYPIIYLDLAACVIGKIGNNSSLCIYIELLMMGSLSSLKELYQLKFQLYSKYQITCKYDLIKQNLP